VSIEDYDEMGKRCSGKREHSTQRLVLAKDLIECLTGMTKDPYPHQRVLMFLKRIWLACSIFDQEIRLRKMEVNR